MQIIDGKLLPTADMQAEKHDPSQILQEVEVGLWTLVKPYVWKVSIGAVFFILGALSYFSLRNSQNSAKIESLDVQVKLIWSKNEENRQWREKAEKEVTELRTKISNLEKLEDRWYNESKMKK